MNLMKANASLIHDVLKAFLFEGEPLSCVPYGNGHINETFLVEGKNRYILQRLNRSVFPHSKRTMDNLVSVTLYLQKQIPLEKERGFATVQEALHLIPTPSGHFAYRDADNNYWRAFLFLPHAISIEEPQTEKEFYEGGKAFGSFLYFLRDYPLEQLATPIPHFHDTPYRYRAFLSAVNKDPLMRAKNAKESIAYLESKADFYPLIQEKLERGELPLRVCHNDTKFNNLLFDETTHEVLEVLDLDTVMKGSLLYDFGDACRSACLEGEEDERSPERIAFSLERFLPFAKGYLAGTHGALSDEEYRLLGDSILLMTLELALRFLSDYLLGDAYFRIEQPDDNLYRAQNQIALAKDIETKLPRLKTLLQEAQTF